MCNYYLKVVAVIKCLLMGEILFSQKLSIPLPPIEKGLRATAESLTEAIYKCISDATNYRTTTITDQRLEWSLTGECVRTHGDIELVGNVEIYSLNSDIYFNRVNYCMVNLERKLAEELAYISYNSYGGPSKFKNYP